MFEFLKKHFEVWQAAWEEEKERRKQKRDYVDEDFLPAALEVMEKPPSPAGRAIVLSILAFFTIAVLWSLIGKVEVVAVAMGRISPSEKVKVIQSADPGVVRAIHVRDGDTVIAGQALIDLDPTFAGADEQQARQALLAAETALARSEALVSYIGGEGAWVFTPPADAAPDLVLMHENLIRSRIGGYEAALKSLEEQRAERAEDLQTAELQLANLEETLPLLKEHLDAREELLEKGLSPRFLVLELRERYLTQKSNIEIQKSQTAKMKAAIAAIGQQITQLNQDFTQTVLQELADASDEAAIRREELKKAEQRNSLQRLISPVAGSVHQLEVNTLGAVVQAAQPLLVIVPAGEELIVEAMVLNKDIGFVDVGDAVAVKLEAFPFTKYGTIGGTLDRLSTDAVEDEALGLVYRARVSLEAASIRVEGKEIPLAPGMVATAEVKTGERRLIEFLLSPLLRYKDESLRER